MIGFRGISGTCVAFVLAVLAPMGPALAISGGRDTSDPDGLRRHVVKLALPDGGTCTGTIVGRTRIVTAAHCFTSSDPRGYKIVVLDRHFVAREIPVAAIRVHPAFNRQALRTGAVVNDIALVRSAEPLPQDMAPAFLAGNDAISGAVTAAGFGYSGWLGRGTLRQAEMRAAHPKLTAMGDFELTADSGTGGTACSGDSGGPIFRKRARGYELVGVISWGSGQCGSRIGMTPVAKYRPFIGN